MIPTDSQPHFFSPGCPELGLQGGWDTGAFQAALAPIGQPLAPQSLSLPRRI